MTTTRLPAPAQLVLSPLSEAELAEEIERHLDFVDGQGRSVHLAAPFVKHFLKRDDNALPIVTAISQTPIVLRDGTVLTGRGLERRYGVVFRVPAALDAIMPKRESCGGDVVAEAMRFLLDDWLCDVAADWPGKCVLVACLLTILERALLPERPAFFVTAGKRGGGKTTALNMVSAAATGLPASAAAWSTNDEERRKAMFAYLGLGLPFLVWDNIAKGSLISCSAIERALTAETISDRVLGVSDTRTVPAFTVQAFTGNNVAPKGDLASRSLTVRLNAGRPDPENREFRHPDPVGWTTDHRGEILRAAYVLLLGNPRRAAGAVLAPAPTRFKSWWDMVGSAVEHAAALVKPAAEGVLSFRDLFLSEEREDAEASATARLLAMLAAKWPIGFKAAQVAEELRSEYPHNAAEAAELRGDIEAAAGKPMMTVTPTVVTWRLKAIVGAPVAVGDEVVMELEYTPSGSGDGGVFRVKKTEPQPPQPPQPKRPF